MNTTAKLMGAMCLTLLLVAACDDDSPLTGGACRTSAITFPNAVGMLWTYEVYDSLTGTSDTVMVSIVDTHSLAGIVEVTVWRYMYGDSVATRLVLLDDDTLKVWYDTCNAAPFELLVFPLELGDIWTGPLERVGDTSWVTGYGTISTPAGDFANATRIDRSWAVDFEGGGYYTTTWIAPGVGSVYRYRLRRWSTGGIVFTIVNEVWELVSYDLNTFEISQFPNEVGWQWTYETYDSNSKHCDTLVVTITDTTTLSGDRHATIWEYVYSDSVDTQFVVTSGNIVEVHANSSDPYPTLLRYEFPLAVGRYWHVFGAFPWFDVIEKGPVTVPAGTFEAGFLHRFGGEGVNFSQYWYSWLVPEVGLVSRRIWDDRSGQLKDVTWELLSYQPAR